MDSLGGHTAVSKYQKNATSYNVEQSLICQYNYTSNCQVRFPGRQGIFGCLWHPTTKYNTKKSKLTITKTITSISLNDEDKQTDEPAVLTNEPKQTFRSSVSMDSGSS
jgi:hypothetical protein